MCLKEEEGGVFEGRGGGGGVFEGRGGRVCLKEEDPGGCV